MRLSLQNKMTAGFGVALLLIMALSFITWRSESENEKAEYWVHHTHDVLTALGTLAAAVSEGESSIHGFVSSDDKSDLDAYRAHLDTIDHEYQALLSLTADNPHQQAQLANLKPLIMRVSQLHKKIETLRSQDPEAAAKEHLTGKPDLEKIRHILRELRQTERDLLLQRATIAASSSKTTHIFILIGSLLTSGLIVIAWMIVRRALAHRLATEAALRDNEENLNITFQSIGDAVLAVDTDQRITRINPVAERLTGWPLAEAMGRPVDEVFRIINEETRQPAVTPIRKVLETGKIHGLANHTLLIARDGSEIPIADSAAPIRDAAGQIHGVVLVFHDVSLERAAEIALKQKEEETRAILDNLIDSIITIDSRGIVHSANSGVMRLLGYTAEEVIGRNVSLLMPEPDHSNHDAYIEHYLRTGEKRVIGIGKEVEGRHKNGQLIPLELHVSEYYFQGERRFAGSLRDIAERRQLIADLTQSKQEAEQANRAKSAFLATMSHEIRTPMNGVIGMVDVLAHTPLSEHQAELLKVIRESGTSLLTIIDDILDFSKIEASRLELERVPVCVADLLEGLCISLATVADHRGVDLHLFISPEIPERVLSDDVRLRQLVNNLVGNAIKFSSGRPDKRGRVSIRAEVAQSDPLKLAFSIADNGIGMTPETLKNLFTPFTQAEVSTTRQFGGTGLGLAICKRLLDMMEGEIAVESTPGLGSTFTVTLPLERAPEQPASSLPDLAGVDCILVNDEGLSVDDLSIYLEHAGARVYREADAAAAAQKAVDLAGVVVIIQYLGHERPVPDAGAAASLPNVRYLMITRGRRQRARVNASGVVTLDGDALRRQALLDAVAVAADRASPGVFHDGAEDANLVVQEISPPSIAEARDQGRLILVAEDDAVNQQVILEQLGLLGYAAEVAQDGEEALRMWRSGNHALLLTDLHMPKMDGYTLTENIRREESEHAHIPILAITANALRGEANRAREVGMDAYITKPVQLRVLRTTLEKWLPHRNSESSPAAPAEAAQNRATSVVDVGVLKEMVGDDEAVVRKLLSVFLASSENMAGELRAAFAAGDSQQVGTVAHKFKSASRSVGALALGNLCAQLERAGMADDAAAIAQCMALFDDAFDAVKAQITQHLAKQ